MAAKSILSLVRVTAKKGMSVNSCEEKKLQLLIVEFDYHAEVLSTICPTLADYFHITLFTTPKIWRKVHFAQECDVNVALLRPGENLKQFFSRQSNTLNGIDIIYFNTLEKRFQFFASRQWRQPIILRVHNVNATFNPWRSIDFGCVNPLRILWHVLRKGIIGSAWRDRKKMLDKADCLMLPSDGVMKYCFEHSLIPRSEKIANFCLPFSVPKVANKFGDAFIEKSRSELVIAVAGTVDPERKDYSILLGAIQGAKKRLSKKIVLHFIGAVKGSEGRKIIDQFVALEDHQFEFHYSLKHVPEQKMSEIMSQVDFFIAPILLATKFKIHREYYGKTKVSGIENDMVNFCKATLITQGYSLPGYLSDGAEMFNGAQELEDKIIAWSQGSGCLDARDSIIGGRQQMVANVAKFETLCRNLVGTRMRA